MEWTAEKAIFLAFLLSILWHLVWRLTRKKTSMRIRPSISPSINPASPSLSPSPEPYSFANNKRQISVYMLAEHLSAEEGWDMFKILESIQVLVKEEHLIWDAKDLKEILSRV